MKWLGVFILAIVLTGCSTYSEEELAAFDQTISNYIDSTGISMQSTQTGLYYHIIDPGQGDHLIQYNDQVTFYYTLSNLKGEILQIVTKNDPLAYKVNQLIIGWQDALMLLKEGGHIKIIVPPQLGYGDRRTELIQPNSILYYDLTVMKVQ